MPKVKANNITMNYDQQGTGDPIILIPYLTADHACYAFQVAEYAKHFTCISLDLRGTGETDKPEGIYSTEVLADDVAAFMRAVGIPFVSLAAELLFCFRFGVPTYTSDLGVNAAHWNLWFAAAGIAVFSPVILLLTWRLLKWVV